MIKTYKYMKQIEPMDNTDYLIMFGLLFVLNLVTGCRDFSHSVCHVQSVNLPCLGFNNPFPIDLN